jgi:foldase protein PrsA
MKKWILALTLAGSVLALGACNQTGSKSSDTVAESKAGNVTQQQLYDAMKEKIGTQALQQLIYEKVLAKKYPVTDKEVNAKVAGLKAQLGSNFAAALAQYGYKDEADLKKTMKVGMMQEKAALKDVKITDKELKTYYDNLKPEITVRHILVKDEKTATEVKKKLDAGEKFEDVAKKYSTDTGTAQNGGVVGVINNTNQSQFDPAFVAGAYALKLNQISAPVKSSFGYHIIQVTAIKAKKPFDQMKKEVEDKVKSSKITTDAINKAMQREIKAANVTVSDKALKAALNPPTSTSSSTQQ